MRLPNGVLVGALIGLVATSIVSVAAAQPELEVDVVGSGIVSAASGTHVLEGTVGQAVVRRASSQGASLRSGLWPSLYLLKPVATARPGEVGATERELPKRFSLQRAYPNPFNPSTRIAFSLPEPAQVHLAVYDALGRKVEVLVDRSMPAGRHGVVFHAAGLRSGIYYYRMVAGPYARVHAITLLK